MSARSYRQYCGIAQALDLLGERWTLLVVRELLIGPKRFGDIGDALPGISTGLLSDRLRKLQSAGVVSRRRLPPPAGSTVYELTDAGRELEPVIMGLSRWGSARMGAPRRGEVFRPAWAMLAMRARHDTDAARGVYASYEFAIGDEVFHAEIDDGRVELHSGTAQRPAVRVRAQPHAFARIAADPDAAHAALEFGELEISGEPQDIARMLSIFAPARPAASARPRSR